MNASATDTRLAHTRAASIRTWKLKSFISISCDQLSNSKLPEKNLKSTRKKWWNQLMNREGEGWCAAEWNERERYICTMWTHWTRWHWKITGGGWRAINLYIISVQNPKNYVPLVWKWISNSNTWSKKAQRTILEAFKQDLDLQDRR